MTQIDLRFARPDVGNLQVVVAPVLRFADVGFNADVRIDQINSPDAIISGFAPELFGCASSGSSSICISSPSP